MLTPCGIELQLMPREPILGRELLERELLLRGRLRRVTPHPRHDVVEVHIRARYENAGVEGKTHRLLARRVQVAVKVHDQSRLHLQAVCQPSASAETFVVEATKHVDALGCGVANVANYSAAKLRPVGDPKLFRGVQTSGQPSLVPLPQLGLEAHVLSWHAFKAVKAPHMAGEGNALVCQHLQPLTQASAGIHAELVKVVSDFSRKSWVGAQVPCDRTDSELPCLLHCEHLRALLIQVLLAVCEWIAPASETELLCVQRTRVQSEPYEGEAHGALLAVVAVARPPPARACVTREACAIP